MLSTRHHYERLEILDTYKHKTQTHHLISDQIQIIQNTIFKTLAIVNAHKSPIVH